MQTTQSIDVLGRRVTYERRGPDDAPPVVLLHGGGFDNALLSWRMLVPELAKEHLVIAPNWPGLSGSKPFDRHYTIDDLGQWLLALLDVLGIGKASFVGISMGGGAALWMATRHPERVDRLIPVGTYGVALQAPYHALTYWLLKLPLNAISYAIIGRSRFAMKATLRSIFANSARVTDEIVDEAMEAIQAAGSGRAFTNFQRGETLPNRLRTHFGDELARVLTPTLFIHGEKDPLIPAESARIAANAMPNGQIVVMDAGHWPMRERPDVFNALVKSFLAEGSI